MKSIKEKMIKTNKYFGLPQIKVLFETKETVVDAAFDSTKKQYFLLTSKGSVILFFCK
jgi:hypothetical protein